MAGRKAKCPKCNTSLVLPSALPQGLELGHPLAEQPQRKIAFSKADIQTVALCAQRLADLIYESMKIARDSRNSDTKISRLGVAKQKLEDQAPRCGVPVFGATQCAED
jgi:hypothetical protein